MNPSGRRWSGGQLLGLLLGMVLASAWACGGGGEDGEPAAGSFANSTAASASKGGQHRPPVILVTIDTLRADRLPAYGYAGVATPHLDGLRQDAILFRNAISPCPLTLPAHVSLLTGLLPPGHGVRNNVGYVLAPAQLTLPALLGQAGYVRGAAVSAYVLRRETGLAAHFDTYLDRMEARDATALGAVQRAGQETVAEATAWLGEQEGPAFLFVHLFEPHTPYTPPEPYRSRYPDPYDGEIAAADAVLGTLMDFLGQQDLYNDALIIVTGDHGEGLGDHGEAEHGILLYREALHVPLMVKLPGGERAGDVVEEPVSLVDILPTVAEVVGLDTPPDLDGRSLLRPDPNRHIYSETFYPRIHFGWSELLSLQNERFHLIQGARPELFDLQEDPREARDVLADHRRQFRQMEAELEAVEGGFEAPAPATDEERARLAALGYLSTPSPQDQHARPDPRDQLAVMGDIGAAFRLSAEGRNQEAVVALQALLTAEPGLQDVRLQLADVLRVLGRYEEAEDLLLESVARFPSLLGPVSLQRAELYLDQDRWQEAALQAEEGMGTSGGRARLLLARAALGAGDLDRAEQEARSSLQESMAPEVPARLVLARVRLRQERYPQALEILEEARRRADGSGPEPWLQFLRGEALARLGRTEEASAAFEQEIESFPRQRRAYLQLAVLRGVQGRFADIEPLLETMVHEDPSPEAYREAAEVLERLGNRDAAAAWRRRAAKATGGSQ